MRERGGAAERVSHLVLPSARGPARIHEQPEGIVAFEIVVAYTPWELARLEQRVLAEVCANGIELSGCGFRLQPSFER